jgi:hypothetical protein
VVATVNVEVWAAVPLRESEAGFRLHVGGSFPFAIVVLTAQVRFTVPAKPFVPATLIVPVFPVVAPGVSVIEVVPPLPAVKPGSAVMVNAMLVVSVNEPEVPVMVTVTGVAVTAAVLLAVRVSTWLAGVEPPAKEVVTPPGRPLADRETAPEKLPTSVSVIVVVPLPPWAIDTVVGEEERVKLDARFTAKLCCTIGAAA